MQLVALVALPGRHLWPGAHSAACGFISCKVSTYNLCIVLCSKNGVCPGNERATMGVRGDACDGATADQYLNRSILMQRGYVLAVLWRR